MSTFKVRFMLDEEPDKVIVEYTVESDWEDDAIAEAHERWSLEFRELARKPFSLASGDA